MAYDFSVCYYCGDKMAEGEPEIELTDDDIESVIEETEVKSCSDCRYDPCICEENIWSRYKSNYGWEPSENADGQSPRECWSRKEALDHFKDTLALEGTYSIKPYIEPFHQ